MYELETKVNGRTRDLMIDEAGKVVSVEQEVTLDSIPAPARDAIQKAVGKGKLLKVETLTEGGKTAYEAAIEVGKKKSEVKVDANGGMLK